MPCTPYVLVSKVVALAGGAIAQVRTLVDAKVEAVMCAYNRTKE